MPCGHLPFCQKPAHSATTQVDELDSDNLLASVVFVEDEVLGSKIVAALDAQSWNRMAQWLEEVQKLRLHAS